MRQRELSTDQLSTCESSIWFTQIGFRELARQRLANSSLSPCPNHCLETPLLRELARQCLANWIFRLIYCTIRFL
jgi:hypothetical protein